MCAKIVIILLILLNLNKKNAIIIKIMDILPILDDSRNE